MLFKEEESSKRACAAAQSAAKLPLALEQRGELLGSSSSSEDSLSETLLSSPHHFCHLPALLLSEFLPFPLWGLLDLGGVAGIRAALPSPLRTRLMTGAVAAVVLVV